MPGRRATVAELRMAQFETMPAFKEVMRSALWRR
jgi:hypothetical protein